jgi:hypothetical protein
VNDRIHVLAETAPFTVVETEIVAPDVTQHRMQAFETAKHPQLFALRQLQDSCS